MNTSAAALMALRAFRKSSLTSSPSGWGISSRTFASKATSTGGGGSTTGGKASAQVTGEGKQFDPPSNVFKQVDKSALGPGASKQSNYKNPEYFSYHNMTYAEMEIVMAKYRVPQPSNSKK